MDRPIITIVWVNLYNKYKGKELKDKSTNVQKYFNKNFLALFFTMD